MSQELRKFFAKKVKSLREKQKLTREELSLLLHLDNSYISKFENGNINITVDQLEKIIKIFNIEIEDFFKI